jgi:hypothetical protein
MRLKGQFIFMGTEIQTSNDGKTDYYKIGLAQGISSKIFYVEKHDYEKYQGIPSATNVDVEIQITERDGKSYYKILDLQIVQAKMLNKAS